MKLFFVLILGLLFGSVSAQDTLDCKPFQQGVFYAQTEDSSSLAWRITRDDNLQTEELINTSEPKDDLTRIISSNNEVIEWIGKCSYKITFDESDHKLTKAEKNQNKHNGIKTSIIKIEGKCCYYTSKYWYKGHEEEVSGKMCLE